MITIREIAARCGFSVATVSRALNGQPGIGQEKAEMIRQLAKEMGYYPNAAAQALKTNRSKSIAILYRNRFAHEFFATVLEGIRAEAEENGYVITFLNYEPDVTFYDRALRQQCAGVILVQNTYPQEIILPLIDSPIPVVSLEQTFGNCTTVANDNAHAIESLVTYLHGLGHRRIAFIRGQDCQVTGDRLAGFLRGCEACGIRLPEEYLCQSPYQHVDRSAEVTRRLLALPQRPTCILYPDDVCYLGGRAAIEAAGLSCPGDVSCVGFDGIALASALRPRLTTYHQDGEEMGRAAVREIIRVIEQPDHPDPRTIVVPGRIQPGDTVRSLNP